MIKSLCYRPMRIFKLSWATADKHYLSGQLGLGTRHTKVDKSSQLKKKIALCFKY